MTRFTLLLAASLMLTVFGTTAARAQEGPPPAVVRLADIVERNMARTVTTPATVMSRLDARIASEASGVVTFIAEPGDFIEAGGLVARLNDREALIRVEEARARLARAAANADYQSAEADRMARLSANGTVAESRVRETALARDVAEMQRREARSALDRAELELERTQIRAPFAGRIAERLIQVGEYSSAGRDVARLVDIESKEAVAQAPVAIAPFLRVGQQVTVSTANGETQSAAIRALIPVGDMVSRTFEVRIDLVGSPWLVGAAVRAAFPAETPRVQLAAPYDAVVLRADGAAVFTVGEDNIARRVPVTTGVRDGGFIAIDGDLEAGRRVVVSGAEVLSDGRPVQELAPEDV